MGSSIKSLGFGRSLAAAGLSLLVLSGCARQLLDGNTTNTRIVTDSGDTENPVRLCTEELSGYTALSVSRFFSGIPVRNIEGAVTYCLTLRTAGSSKVTGSLRVEFEDDFGQKGLKSVHAAAVDDTFFGELKQTTTGYDLDLLLVDGYGIIEVRAHADGSGPMIGTIRHYDFPTYEEGLEAQVEEMREQCKNAGKPGYPTVANCLGYNYPPTFWWNEPAPTTSYQKQLADARIALADTSKTFKLGNISFDLGTVLDR
jgi:hypothetical protein